MFTASAQGRCYLKTKQPSFIQANTSHTNPRTDHPQRLSKHRLRKSLDQTALNRNLLTQNQANTQSNKYYKIAERQKESMR